MTGPASHRLPSQPWRNGVAPQPTSFLLTFLICQEAGAINAASRLPPPATRDPTAWRAALGGPRSFHQKDWAKGVWLTPPFLHQPSTRGRAPRGASPVVHLLPRRFSTSRVHAALVLQAGPRSSIPRAAQPSPARCSHISRGEHVVPAPSPSAGALRTGLPVTRARSVIGLPNARPTCSAARTWARSPVQTNLVRPAFCGRFAAHGRRTLPAPGRPGAISALAASCDPAPQKMRKEFYCRCARYAVYKGCR